MFRNKPLFVVFLLAIFIAGQLQTTRTIAAQSANQKQPEPAVTQQPQLDQESIIPQRGQDTPLPSQELMDARPCKTCLPAQKRRVTAQAGNNCPRCPSSGISPDDCNDSTFVVDCGAGLDTGCTFRDGSPLVITLKIGRVVGDVAKLKAAGLISATAKLKMPAFDVDFFGGGGIFNPERDRVTFNGNVVPGEFLQGDNNVWRLNEFEVPIEWVNFPSDPGQGGTVTPADNTIRIDIDTANSQLVWCVAIDWVEVQIDVARPVVMAHGILSSGATWSSQWVPALNQLGLPNTNELNMGNLDSIGNNAGKISNVVNASKQRWGVDRVNIVAHSKGGLDSRDYIENADTVEQLIQLGTPNAGSPLADKIQEILIRGGARFGIIGALAPVLIETFAAPAAIQLTTPYMAFYNATHGSNPNVQYTALAGDYDPNCFFLSGFGCALDNLLIGLTGRGDTIVPVSSVHALPYTQNRVFFSSGSDQQAKHTSLTGSAGVYNSVRDRVVVFGRRSALEALSTPSPLVSTASTVDSIQQGQLHTHTIEIDQAPAFVSLMYPSGNLDMALISPSGQRFDATTVVGNANVSRTESAYLGGNMEVYNFLAPEIGVWQVEVTAPSVVAPGGTVGYAVTGWIANPAITFDGSLAKTSIHTGDSLRLFGTLRNSGAPITAATVKAQVGLPDNTVSEIVLHDDGANGDATANDGIYTADFTSTAQAGNYRIAFIANAAAAGGVPAFSREDFELASVSRSASTITGPFTESGVDTDGDGLFNNLTVQTTVNITTTGTYRLYGSLTDSAGHSQNVSTKVTLNAGSNIVALKFDGATIFNNRTDGPYTLSVFRLAEEGDLTLAIVDERANALQTASYGYRNFQHPPIFLTGAGTSTGVDTNGNGQFDLLNVGVGVEVRSSGFYQWSARLTDRNGRELGFAANSAFLNAGSNTLSLTFDGRSIGRNGVDGPYFVRSLLFFGAGDSLLASNAFTTSSFLANQFEGFVADSTPPTLQVSLSPSILPRNHNMALITATITVSDNVDPNPMVELVSITANEPVNGRGDGNTVFDIDGADFGTDDRQFFLRGERSGNGTDRIYTVTYRARDAAGNTTTATATVTVPHDSGQ